MRVRQRDHPNIHKSAFVFATALRKFREETAALHRDAESYVRFLDHDATCRDYVRYLRVMYGYHAPIEALLANASTLRRTGYDPCARGRVHLLAKDLVVLGDEGPYPSCQKIPSLDSLPRQLGAAYVLEGSTLGGRWILAKLPRALISLRGVATSYLEAYGARTASRWRSFGEIVSRELADPRALHEGVEAARDTFARLIEWMSLHERPSLSRIRKVS